MMAVSPGGIKQREPGSRWPGGGPGRVLAVVDRLELVELITLTLNDGACSVRSVVTADDVALVAREWDPHVLILDMALDGTGVMQRVRAVAGWHLLVIGLVSQVDLQTKLAAFRTGVDDILAVPFAPQELRARVMALLRCSTSAVPSAPPRLTSLELALLSLLAANPSHHHQQN